MPSFPLAIRRIVKRRVFKGYEWNEKNYRSGYADLMSASLPESLARMGARSLLISFATAFFKSRGWIFAAT